MMAWGREKYRRKPFSVKLPTCKFCGEIGKHYSWQCPNKPRKALKKEAPKSQARRQRTSREWYESNPPPNPDGTWTCYLQISPLCPKRVDRTTINLEHVKPRAKYQHLKYDPSNIRPACEPCNKLKGPWTLEQLAETYPKIRKMLEDGFY